MSETSVQVKNAGTVLIQGTTVSCVPEQIACGIQTHLAITDWPSALVSLMSMGGTGSELASHDAPKVLDMAIHRPCTRWLIACLV